MEYGQMAPGQRITRRTQETYLCVILEGTVDIQFGNNFDLFNSNCSLGKRNARKRNNRISHFSDLNDTQIRPVAELNTCYNIRAVTTGFYLKFPKKIYQEFIEWIQARELDSLIKFLSMSLDISVQDIKLYRIHKKVQTKEICLGQKIKFQQNKSKNCDSMYLLLKGELRLEFRLQTYAISNHKGIEQTEVEPSAQYEHTCSVFISEGAIISNAQFGGHSSSIQYVEGLATKECTLIIFSQTLINQISQTRKQLIGKIHEQCKRIEKIRLEFINRQMSHTVLKYDNSARFKTEQQNCRRFTQSGKIHTHQGKCLTLSSEVDFDSFKKGQRFSRKKKRNPALSAEYQDFVSNYPYRKIAESQEKVYKTKSMRAMNKKQTFDKINNYLKQSQIKQKKMNEKILRLKLKNMAEKTMPTNTRLSVNVNETTNLLKRGLFDQQDLEKSTLQSSNQQQMLLASNDTGIITEFIKGSRVYQRQMAYLLKKNQRKPKMYSNKQNLHLSEFSSIFSHQKIRKIITGHQNKQQIPIFPNQDPRHIFYNKCITQIEQDFLNVPEKRNHARSRDKTIMRRLKSGKIIKVKLNPKQSQN